MYFHTSRIVYCHKQYAYAENILASHVMLTTNHILYDLQCFHKYKIAQYLHISSIRLINPHKISHNISLHLQHSVEPYENSSISMYLMTGV